MDKKDRFQAAFEHLRHNGLIKTQKDVANKIGGSSQNVSMALSGNPRALTDAFLQRFLTAFPDLFSTEWLMEGNGVMLLSDKFAHSDARPYNVIADNSPAFVSDFPNQHQANAEELTLASISAQISTLTSHIAILTSHVDARLSAIENLLKTLNR